jgi:ribulokinase
VRSCIFDERGKLLGMSSFGLHTSRPHAGWVEQDPDEWTYGVEHSLREAIQAAGIDPSRIVAVACASTSCTIVPVDNAGRHLRPAIMWMDERAWRQADVITATADPVLRYTGSKESPQWGLPKTMWLMENERYVYDRASLIVEQTDYITHQMAGVWTSSRSNASAKWHYVRNEGGWPSRLLDSLGLSSVLPKLPQRVLAVGAPVGPVLREFARRTGLSTGTLVVQGGVDSHAAMVGVGAIEPGSMAMIVGTSTCHMAQSAEPIFADVWGPYPESVREGVYTIGGGQSTTGSIVNWLVNDVALGSIDYERIDDLASEVPPGSEGLIALDFFQGNRTPYKDPLARGAVLGLTLRHGLAHICRAFYEATAYGTRAIIENLAQHGYHVNRLLAAGGGTRSDLWMRIHASVNGRTIEVAGNEEPTALGAAIWAGMGSGVFQDYEEAVNSMVAPGKPIMPDDSEKSVYDFYYSKYVELYERLKPLMHDVARFESDGVGI